MFEVDGFPKKLPPISPSEFMVVYSLYSSMLRFVIGIQSKDDGVSEDALNEAIDILRVTPQFTDHANELNERILAWLTYGGTDNKGPSH